MGFPTLKFHKVIFKLFFYLSIWKIERQRQTLQRPPTAVDWSGLELTPGLPEGWQAPWGMAAPAAFQCVQEQEVGWAAGGTPKRHSDMGHRNHLLDICLSGNHFPLFTLIFKWKAVITRHIFDWCNPYFQSPFYKVTENLNTIISLEMLS